MWLNVLAASSQKNEPKILEQHLIAVAHERKEVGYTVGELHTIIEISERYLQNLIHNLSIDQIERNAREALLGAVMDAARMVISVNCVL